MKEEREKKLTGTRSIAVQKIRDSAVQAMEDLVAVEEPLEIRLAWGRGAERQQQSLAITMRTPGEDGDLALGFLYTEGLVTRKEEIVSLKFPAQLLSGAAQENVIQVELAPGTFLDLQKLSRHFYTSSSCGVCGKASLELVQQTIHFGLRKEAPKVALEVLYALPSRLRIAQSLFDRTGGIHAAALFDEEGTLLLLREDVGRHNALDKLIGAAFREGRLPLSDSVLLVSGRASFELVQKALLAGIPVMAAVGAPSSLAVAVAEEYGMTLVGFLRSGSCNLYCGQERLLL